MSEFQRETSPAPRKYTITRATITRAAYLDGWRRGAYACFGCGTVARPRQLTVTEEAAGARERHCGECRAACALPLETAVSEGWLVVTEEAQSG